MAKVFIYVVASGGLSPFLCPPRTPPCSELTGAGVPEPRRLTLPLALVGVWLLDDVEPELEELVLEDLLDV